MNSNIITGYFQTNINNIPSVVTSPSYEQYLQMSIKCTDDRIKRLQDAGNYYEADRELYYSEGLMKALKIYRKCIKP